MDRQDAKNGTSAKQVAPTTADHLSCDSILGRRLTVILLGAMVVMAGLLASPVFRGRIPVHGDLGNFNLPMRHFYSQCLKHGDAFDWFPGIFCGYFLTGEGQHGPYHPVHWLMYRWLPLEIAWDLEVFLPIVVLAAGMIVFLRRYVDWTSACLGALVATFSMKFVGNLQHPQIAIILAHLPWLLAAIDLAVSGVTAEKKWCGGGFIALLVGSAVLLGHPQSCWILLFTCSLFAAWRLVTERACWRAWAAAVGGVAMGLCIGTVQLFATYSLYISSGRVKDSAADSARQIIDPIALYGVVAPFLSPYPEDYFGVLPLILTLWWITAYRIGPVLSQASHGDTSVALPDISTKSDRTIRQLSLCIIILIFLTAWLAMGQEGGLYHLILWLPVVGKFHVPFRFIIATQLFMGIATALAFSRLSILVQKREKTGWGHLVLPWCAVGITVGMAVAWSDPDDKSCLGFLFQGPSNTGIWLMVIGALGLTLAARGRRIGLWLLVILAVFDISIYSVGNTKLGKVYWRKLPTYQEFLDSYAGPPAPPQGRIFENNFEGRHWMWVNRMCLHGYRLVAGYTALTHNLTMDYGHINTLRMANVHWWRDPNLPVVAGLGPPTTGNWRPVPNPLPRVRMLSSVRVSDNPREDLKHIDVDTTAIVSHPITLTSSAPGTVELIKDKPGNISVEVIAPKRQLLVISEGYHPEWQVHVDGQSAPVERVNGDFMGCVLDAGKHRVEFTFRPRSVRLGLLVSLTAFLGVLLAGFGPCISKKLQPALHTTVLGHFHERTLTVMIVGAILVLAGVFASPLFFGRIPAVGDLGGFNLPVRHFYAQCLQQGDAFDWMPSIYGGYNITGEGQHGPYHPLHWLMYRFLPLDTAFAMEVFLPIVILATGMIFFLKRYVGYTGACVGALFFTFSTKFVGHMVHLQLATVLAHIPWLLGMMDVAVEASSNRRRCLAGAALAILTGSQILLGHPQALWFSLCAEGVFLVYLWLFHAASWKGWATLLGGMGLGCCLGAVQLLATYSFFSSTDRASADATFVNSYSLTLQTYLGVVAPYLSFPQSTNSPQGVYFGTVPLMLSIWWIGNSISRKNHPSEPVDEIRQRNTRRLTFFALTLGILSIWLSLGFSGKLYYLHTYLPLVGKFRCPDRFSTLAAFCFVILGSVAFTQLITNVKSHHKLPWKTLLLPFTLVLFAVSMAFWYGSGRFTPPTKALEAQCFAGPVVVGAAVLALALAVRGRPLGLVLLVIVAIADISLYSVGHPDIGKRCWYRLPTYDEFLVQCYAPPTTHEGHIYDERFGMMDTLGLHGYRAINGYASMPPLRHLKYDNINAWRVAQVQMVCLWDPPSAELSAAGVGTRMEGGWRMVPPPLPRVRLVSKAIVSTTPNDDIKKISVDDTVLISRPMELTPSTPGNATLIEDRPGRITVETDAPQRQLLTVSESYYPDWKVCIDGQPASLEQVNGDFFGCAVNGGKHRVEFTFAPESLRLGRLASLISFAVLLIAVAVPAVGIFKYRS